MPNKFALVLAALAAAACSSPRNERAAEQPKKVEKAPDQFRVKFGTSKGDFVVEVNRDWAPRGADRFYELVERMFFDDARFFRVVKGFVVQFGINKDPQVTKFWREMTLVDDPVKQSNQRGTLSFATSGPNTRTTQVFINLTDNARLDARGFAPFGRVVEGMDVVSQLYAGYGDSPPMGYYGPDQNKIEAEGNAYLERSFNRLDYIKTARLIP
jgi:peptidyl-prolyl cis-trans isomerase A (cyclophilin A)